MARLPQHRTHRCCRPAPDSQVFLKTFTVCLNDFGLGKFWVSTPTWIAREWRWWEPTTEDFWLPLCSLIGQAQFGQNTFGPAIWFIPEQNKVQLQLSRFQELIFFPACFLNVIFDQAEFETEEIFQGPWKTALLWRSHFSNI